jgi:hypothetical protein
LCAQFGEYIIPFARRVFLARTLFFLSTLSLGYCTFATFDFQMSISPLKVNDVVYGIGGAFDKRLGKITKLNPWKPAVEDGSGRRSCYGRENLKRVGAVDSRFGRCSLCKRPGDFAKPCPYNGIGKHQCQGTIQGNFDWRMKVRAPLVMNAPREKGQHKMGVFLAKQLRAALFLLGFSEISEDIIDSLKHGLREASIERRSSRLEPLSVSSSSSSGDSKSPKI